MRPNRFAFAVLALAGTMFAPQISNAAPVPSQAAVDGPALPLIRTGERQAGAVAAGAIMGGAVGLMLGSQLARPAPPPVVVHAPPPPEADVVEEEVVPVRRRVTRRVVEIEEAAPEIVEEECLTRRTRIYDPNSGGMVIRKERDCR